MLNTFLYNSEQYNKVVGSETRVYTEGDILFNDFLLQGAVVVASSLRNNAPTRAFDTARIPRGHGRIILGDYFDTKLVKIKGVLIASTPLELAEKIDEFKKALSAREGNLDTFINGQFRRYVATWTNTDSTFPDQQNYEITFLEYSAEFLVLDPFGKALNYTSSSLFAQTDMNLDEEVENTGTADAKGIWIVVFSAVNAVTAVSIKNNTRAEQIKITETINAGDILQIDSELKRVLLNDTAIDYEGFFPDFSTGINSYTLDITGTSVTYDITAKYKKSYL